MNTIINNNKLDKLEAVRGFAALYVVLHHMFASGIYFFGINFSFLFRFGQEAVILFFILSGFVISYSFEKSSNKSFSLFFTKRFMRIYLPLIIVCITHYLLQVYDKDEWLLLNWKQVLGNLFMLQDNSNTKPNVLTEPFLDNDPLWSLSYEWWFYMIYFILFRYSHKKRNLVVYTLGIIAALSYCFYPNFLNRELMYLVIWWAGVELSVAFLKGKKINFLTINNVMLVLLIIVIILSVQVALIWKTIRPNLLVVLGKHPILEWRHFVFCIIVLITAITWKKFKWIGFNCFFAPFTSFASTSFVLYISHYFLIVKANYLERFQISYHLKIFFYFSICFVFSYIVERKIYPIVNKIVMKRLFSNC